MATTKPRDSQRSKVYRWESGWVLNPPLLSLERCQEIVNEVCKAYDVDPPLVEDGRRRRRACYSHNHTIKLPRHTRTTHMVLHEAAHAIAARRRPYDLIRSRYKKLLDGGHGPTFVRIYINLLAKYGDTKLTVSALVMLAKACGVKVAPAEGLRPPTAAFLRDLKHKIEENRQHCIAVSEELKDCIGPSATKSLVLW